MDNTNVIGQYDAAENAIDYRPALAGAGPEVTVEIANPLTQDFSVKFAVSVAQAPRLSPDQQRFQDRMAEFGIPLTKQGNQMAQAIKYTIIPAGKTIKLPGNVAQVAVRQLVTEILMRRGQRNKVADPRSRQDVEQEIIQNYAAFAQLPLSDEDPIDRQIRELNQAEAVKDVPNPPPGTGVTYEPIAKTAASVPGEPGETDTPSAG